MENDKVCTLIIDGDKKIHASAADIQKKIEAASSEYMQRKNAKKLVDALEELLLAMVNGNSYPKLLMTIIRFVITCDDHRVKKLLGLYWVLCDKVKENGEIKEEMVLVCNAIRNDLIHANEYIRGRTLRLLCRMRYFKILEPLIESILKNLSHRHAYVRRNAVACVYSIVKTFGPDVIPQASVEIEQLLLVEGDLSTKRIAFIMLTDCDIDRAVHYAISVEEQVTSLGDVFQLAILELVRKVSLTKPTQKSKLMKSVFYLALASSPAVMFECAQILCKHAGTPSAVQIAVNAYVSLLNSQPDNNVKLVVLEKVQEIASNDANKHVVESVVMDILRGLSCPATGVREKIIDLVSSLLTRRNVGDVIGFLKKELAKANSPENIGSETIGMYRRKLILTLQQACRDYPAYADSIVPTLVEMLSYKESSVDVISFLREVVVSSSGISGTICDQLIHRLGSMTQSKVARVSLWLVGEFADPSSASVYLRAILDVLGSLPIKKCEDGNALDTDVDKPADDSSGSSTMSQQDESKKPAANHQVVTTKTVVLADGTYASQAVYSSVGAASTLAGHLRSMIRNGDILLASVLGVVLAKLFVKTTANISGAVKNEVMFAIACLAKLVKENISFGDASEYVARLTACLRVVVGSPSDAKLIKKYLTEWSSSAARDSLGKLVAEDVSLTKQRSRNAVRVTSVAPPDRPVSFRLLREKRELLVAQDPSLEEVKPSDLFSAIPGVLANSASIGGGADVSEVFSLRLAKASPLTGLADPVYIEGFLRLVGFDLVLELSLVNRSKDTLQNVLVELYTQGADMKVVDKPAAVTLGPGESAKTFATIKVSSTENGVVFGYATFDRKSALDKEWIVLNELHADVLEYICKDTVIQETEYKTMWQEFEWENKIVVNTNVTKPDEFVSMLMKHTNLSLVGNAEQAKAAKQLLRNSQFAAVNLYAKSIFGEDALVNVSMEKSATTGLVGSVRIRARAQGIALSLGDRVTQVQKEQKLRGA